MNQTKVLRLTMTGAELAQALNHEGHAVTRITTHNRGDGITIEMDMEASE